jgi:DNA-binding NarL/FixJ family response regulator
MAIHLSKRDTDVCALVAVGRANKEIAAQLGLSAGTIKEYVHRLFVKGVTNRTQLAMWWLSNRIDDVPLGVDHPGAVVLPE